MVLFLCSEKAGFITGENICIDGGMTKQMIYHGDCGWTLDEWKQKSYEKAEIKNLTAKNAEIMQKWHINIDWKIFNCYNNKMRRRVSYRDGLEKFSANFQCSQR